MQSTVVQVPVVLDSDNVFAAITWQNQPLELKISLHAVCLASEVWRKSLLHPMILEEEYIPSRYYSIDHEESNNMNADDTEPNLMDQDPTTAQGIEDVALPLHKSPQEVKPESDELIGNNLVFAHQVSGSYNEEQTDGKARHKALDLVEDNTEAILLLLRIVHLQFDKIPSFLSFQELLEVARLCDYYQCPHLVRPWLPKGLEKERVESKLPGQEEWLLITWVFGREQVLTDLATKMVREVTTNKSGQLVSGAGNVLILPLPPGIIESMLEVRQETITKLLEIPYQAVNRYADHKGNVCQAMYEGNECDALVFGSLIRGLQKISLWPRRLPSEIHRSLNSLNSDLTSLQIIQLRLER